jgi:hypothetical protein
MKHLKKITESFDVNGSEIENSKLNLDLKYVSIWEPKESDIEKLTEIILSSFNDSEIVSINGSIIKVKQGNIIKEGSASEWCMAINEIISNNGEDVMRLFFWQGDSPLDDLISEIENYEE